MAGKSRQSCGGCLVLIVLAGIGVYFVGSSFDKKQQAEQQRQAALTPEQRQAEDKANAEAEAKRQQDNEFERRKLGAEDFSKQYVLKFLKHPDDASFGFWDTPTVTSNPERDTFFVSSKVKAKNDFGAELTYQWATIITLDGNTWELVSCVIDGETVYSSETLLNKLKASKQLSDAKQEAADKRAKAEAKKKRQAEIEETKWRTWTDVKGKHTVEAKFGGMAFGTVTLTKRDGTSVKVPLEELSDEDKEWISTRAKAGD
jgi:hypothetical protein